MFVPKHAVVTAQKTARRAGYELFKLGVVEAGERCIVFEPESITFPPPGD